MAYLKDADLEFLSKCSDKDLNDLVYCLTHGKDGQLRLTQELTDTQKYKQYYPKHSMYWQEIAGEIQCFGANTFMTILRGGQGVPYKEILCDVCNKLKVPYDSQDSTEDIEQALILKFLADTINEMPEGDRKKLVAELKIPKSSSASTRAVVSAARMIFKQGGFQSYQITMIVANMAYKSVMGRGLSLVANSTITKTMSILAGPVGWAFTTTWAMIDISGSAYRVTVPAVFEIALLRQAVKNKKKRFFGLF